ncbi:hypothetical protein ACT7DP_26140 [Bacillus paranthracis]
MERQFEIVSAYSPQGDQPVAIEKLVEGINSGKEKASVAWSDRNG